MNNQQPAPLPTKPPKFRQRSNWKLFAQRLDDLMKRRNASTH